MGWLADEKKKQSRTATEKEFYLAAYEAQLYKVWAGSPWEREIPQLAQARAYAAMLNREEHYVRDARSLIYHYLDGEFKTETEDDILNLYRRQLSTTFPFRQVLDTTFTHYDEPPTRTVGEEGLNERVADLYAAGRVDAMLSEKERDAGLMQALAVRPVWRGERQDLDVYTPDVYRVRVRTDDPYTAEEIAYVRVETIGGSDTIVLKHWTAEEIITRKAGAWTTVLRREPNPYGRLPFAFLRMRRGTSFYGQGDWDLVEEAMRVHRVALLTGLDIGSAFGIILALNLGITSENPLQIGPGRILAKDGVAVDPAGSGGEPVPVIERIAGQGQYRDMNELRDEMVRETKQARHLPASEIDETSGAPESGFARYLAMLPLIRQKSRYRAALVEFERDLAPVMMHVATVDSGGAYSFSEADMSADVSLDFADDGIVMEPADEQAYDRARTKEGLMSPLDYVRKWGQLDQRLTEAEATKLIAANRDLFTQIFGTTDELSGRTEPADGSQPGGDPADGVPQDGGETDPGDSGAAGAGDTTGGTAE